MATKAEQARVEKERANARAHASKKEGKHRKLAQRRAHAKTHESGHAGRKATHALDEHASDTRPSRKSSRKGANRLKADTNFNLREERGRSSPETRNEQSRIRSTRVRGRARARR